jgi:phosphoribosylformylglycinamidine synthase
MVVKLLVTAKDGVPDPQARTKADEMVERGYEVHSVKQGKYFELQIDTEDEAEARRIADEVAGKLLANPVIEQYEIIEVVKNN